jgi:nucleoside-diphosphate-sugar epimerase
MKKIVVTGSASAFANELLPILTSDERIEQVIGIDRSESALRHERFTQVLLDLRSPQIARVLAGADALVHLDSSVRNDADAPLTESGVHPGQNVFRCAAQQQVPIAVYLSSAAVYELPARQRPIDEQQPRAAPRGFGWAEDHVALESWLDTFESEHPSMRIVRLRPHLIVGTHGTPAVRRLLRSPFTVRLARTASVLQCVHALDVARAVQHALHRDVATGAFNLACADTATLREMQRLSGGGWISIPFAIAYRLARRATRATGGGEPVWMELLRHEVVLNTNRARRRLGWKPLYGTVTACLTAPE